MGKTGGHVSVPIDHLSELFIQLLSNQSFEELATQGFNLKSLQKATQQILERKVREDIKREIRDEIEKERALANAQARALAEQARLEEERALADAQARAMAEQARIEEEHPKTAIETNESDDLSDDDGSESFLRACISLQGSTLSSDLNASTSMGISSQTVITRAHKPMTARYQLLNAIQEGSYSHFTYILPYISNNPFYICDAYNNIPLTLAISQRYSNSPISQDRLSIIEHILTISLDSIQYKKNGKNILMLAAETGCEAIFNLILNSQNCAHMIEEIRELKNQKSSILSYANRGKNPSIINSILKHFQKCPSLKHFIGDELKNAKAILEANHKHVSVNSASSTSAASASSSMENQLPPYSLSIEIPSPIYSPMSNSSCSTPTSAASPIRRQLQTPPNTRRTVSPSISPAHIRPYTTSFNQLSANIPSATQLPSGTAASKISHMRSRSVNTYTTTANSPVHNHPFSTSDIEHPLCADLLENEILRMNQAIATLKTLIERKRQENQKITCQISAYPSQMTTQYNAHQESNRAQSPNSPHSAPSGTDSRRSASHGFTPKLATTDE